MFNVYLLSAITCAITFVLFIPFINFLYRVKIQDPVREKNRIDKFGHTVDVFDSLKASKSGTPTGGGILVVLVTSVLFSLIYYFRLYNLSYEKFTLIIFTFLIFGFIGLLDDLNKVFKFKGAALRVRHKFIIQFAAGALISYWGVIHNLFTIKLPFINAELTNPYLLFGVGVFTIVFMSNAFNILDGIDGLSSGSLLITLIPLTVFVVNTPNSMAEFVFIYLLFGAALAYLYFNINPARLFMGDTGALAFGAIIGLLTMTTGTLILLPVFGIVYIIDALSSIVQWSSMYFWNGRRVFKIAPIHHHFEAIGWEGTKVVFRFWVLNVFFSLLAVGLFFLLR